MRNAGRHLAEPAEFLGLHELSLRAPEIPQALLDRRVEPGVFNGHGGLGGEQPEQVAIVLGEPPGGAVIRHQQHTQEARVVDEWFRHDGRCVGMLQEDGNCV